MCTYCYVADEFFKSPQPPMVWPVLPPYVPAPTPPPAPGYIGWDLPRLKELHEVLEKIKRLEDALACPCEASKADYIKLLRDRIAELEQALAEEMIKREHDPSTCQACKASA